MYVSIIPLFYPSDERMQLCNLFVFQSYKHMVLQSKNL